MTIADTIAAAHRQTTTKDRALACSCRQWVVKPYAAGDISPFAQWARHVAQVTEAAVRADITARIADYAARDIPRWTAPGARDLAADTFNITQRIAAGDTQ